MPPLTLPPAAVALTLGRLTPHLPTPALREETYHQGGVGLSLADSGTWQGVQGKRAGEGGRQRVSQVQLESEPQAGWWFSGGSRGLSQRRKRGNG